MAPGLPRVTQEPRVARWPLERAGEGASLRISPDGRVLALRDGDGAVRLADLELGRSTFAFQATGGAGMALGAALVAWGTSRGVEAANTLAGRPTGRQRLPGGVRDVALAPDGAVLAAVDGEGTLRLLRAASLKEVGEHRGEELVQAAVGWRAERVWGATAAGGLVEIDPDGGPVAERLPAASGVVRVLAVAGRWGGAVALLGDGGLRALDGASLPDAPGFALDVALDGRCLVAGGETGVWVQEAQRWRRVADLPVRALALHPVCAHVAVLTGSGEVGVMALADGRLLGAGAPST